MVVGVDVIILLGLGVLGIIIALGIMFSVTVRPPPAFLLGRKKSAGIQVEFGAMLPITQERQMR